MVERAKVRSVEALEQFRTSLVIYLEKAGAALDEVSEEVTRTRNWIQMDRRTYWERERSRRQCDLEQKEQELFSARLSGFRDDLSLQQMAVTRARRAVEEAVEKLHCIRCWSQQFDSRVAPLHRRTEQLRHTLIQDMGQGVYWLAQAVKTLEAYAELKPAGGVPIDKPAAQPAEPKAAVASVKEDSP